MRAFFSLCLIALLYLPAFAQDDDAMEAQRCIWRCLYNSKGADDPAYQACIDRQCNGPEAGTWIFGEHTKLGLSAHVEIGEEAFGVACKSDAPEGSMHIASLRMTPGLALKATKEQGIAIVYVQPFEIGGQIVLDKNPLGFVETLGGYCTTQIKELRTSKKLLLLREKLLSLDFTTKATILSVEKDGLLVAIRSVKDLDNLAEAIVVPLKGARKAIDQLLKTCPAIRRLISEDCTGGH